jgi:hypothetical protein
MKASLFYTDAANDAITGLTASTAAAVVQFCRTAAADAASITFIGDAVFVNGQILKASRETHLLTQELRGQLELCDVTELTLRSDVTRDALARFARLLASASKDRSRAQQLVGADIPGISARKAVFAGAGGEVELPAMRASRTYALSVLTVQRVLSEMQKHDLEHSRLIKRVAQRIVGQVDDDGRLLVALAAVAGASADPAVIAVGSAILSVAMLRQLTNDRSLLSNAAAAALLLDAAHVALARASGGPFRTLNDDELDQVPARSVVVLTAMGRMHAPARLRTVLVYEAWLQRRAHRRGPPYQGKRAPTILSRILATARAFSELRAADSEGKMSIDDALQVLTNRAVDGTERAFVRLLVGALGIFPAGTMVELSTGELAVVMGTPAAPVDYVRPRVKILYDSSATLLDSPIDLDLAAPRAPGAPLRFIRRNIDADDQQLKAMRSYVLAATAATRRGALGQAQDASSQAAVPQAPVPITEVPPSRRLAPTEPPGAHGGMAARGAPVPAAPAIPTTRPGVPDPPSPASALAARRPYRPILPRTDSPFPTDPPSSPSAQRRARVEEPPSVGTSPSRRERPVVPRDDAPPSAAAPSVASSEPKSAQSTPGKRRELRPILPRTDTPIATNAAAGSRVPAVPVPVPAQPAASPDTIAAERARAAKMTESMPPTGLRSAIFGGRALESPDATKQPDATRNPQQQIPTRPQLPEVSLPPDDAPPGVPTQPTRQVNWHDYGKIVNPERVQTVPKIEAQKEKAKEASENEKVTAPPPSRTVHDDLLAAFLADEPIPPSDDEDPPAGRGRGDGGAGR